MNDDDRTAGDPQRPRLDGETLMELFGGFLRTINPTLVDGFEAYLRQFVERKSLEGSRQGVSGEDPHDITETTDKNNSKFASEEVKADLVAKGIEAVEVHRLHSRKKGHYDMVLVKITKNDRQHDIFQIKEVCHLHGVRAEYPRAHGLGAAVLPLPRQRPYTADVHCTPQTPTKTKESARPRWYPHTTTQNTQQHTHTATHRQIQRRSDEQPLSRSLEDGYRHRHPQTGENTTDPTSYRPISLLSTLGKLYEKVVLTRIQTWCNEEDILIQEQFGFRARHSCVHQVHRIVEHVLDGFSRLNGLKTGAIFLDVSKAFDGVWHSGLIYKLYQLGIPDRLLHLVADFLSNRLFRYRVESTLSAPHPIRAGVPQGSALSPLLYSLYTNDIPHTPLVELALFADDTALYFTHHTDTVIHKHLQRATNALAYWCKLWRIEVNPDKSSATIGFHPTNTHHRNMRHITLNNTPKHFTTHTKYLGVTLDYKMSFREHIAKVKEKAQFVSADWGPCSAKKAKYPPGTNCYQTDFFIRLPSLYIPGGA
ncbi:uncharacterized protein LOC125240087 [Leguminivora glycinivorella]|uniref:uncharacterized protein LOC125240087 n=1 Tax=Leguminivora glycinivorella TaxID=1035111 RepID=UPI00200DD31A|nr:uncharacterized protein LOC125240087 [Leguminivora glycinivorella]